MKTKGEIIASRRKALGYTQADLAKKLYVSDKAVSKWERDLASPDVASLPALANILEISVDELLAGKTTKKPSEFADILDLILKVIPLAMGIALIVLSYFETLDFTSAISLIGIGLTSLSLWALNQTNTEK